MIEQINNGDIGAEVRRKLNANFQQLLDALSQKDISALLAAFELKNVGTEDEPDFQLVAKKALFAYNANAFKIDDTLTLDEYLSLREEGGTIEKTLYLICEHEPEQEQGRS